MNKKSRRFVVFGMAALFASCQHSSSPDKDLISETEAIHQTMDAWHHAASVSDSTNYFGAMASDESIFLGTDETERWTTTEFKAWSRGFFQRTSAWTFVPVPGARHITVQGEVAWLDEQLDSEHMGRCRGTGILVFDAVSGSWKIAHYTLSFAVPNSVANAVIDTIRAWNDSN